MSSQEISSFQVGDPKEDMIQCRPVFLLNLVLGDGSGTGIDDSKKLKEKERERLYEVITSTPGVVFAVSRLCSNDMCCPWGCVREKFVDMYMDISGYL